MHIRSILINNKLRSDLWRKLLLRSQESPGWKRRCRVEFSSEVEGQNWLRAGKVVSGPGRWAFEGADSSWVSCAPNRVGEVDLNPRTFGSSACGSDDSWCGAIVITVLGVHHSVGSRWGIYTHSLFLCLTNSWVWSPWCDFNLPRAPKVSIHPNKCIGQHPLYPQW